MWQLILDIYGYVIFFYSMTLIVSYVILMLLAQKGIFTQYDEIEESYAKHIVWNNPYTPGVSIVAPAFNEEKTIIDNVESLLMQDYPLFEVVIVNDGSRDSTLEKLITNFELEKVPFNYVEHIHTKPFKALYRSRNPKYYQLSPSSTRRTVAPRPTPSTRASTWPPIPISSTPTWTASSVPTPSSSACCP